MSKIYFSLALLFFSFVGCSEWLDVRSKSEIEVDDMFSTADGYYSALTGIYVSMGEDPLYAGTMTIAGLEVLSQQYKVRVDLSPSGNDLDSYRKEWVNFEYTVAGNEKRIASVWEAMYHTIVNDNVLIEQLEKTSLPYFEDGVVQIMKGEALGLRAYLYFDLIRMFNEAYSVNPNSANVPYKIDFGANVGDKVTTTQLLNFLIEDLKMAQGLMKDYDPIVTEKKYTDKYIAFDRTQRMNYYAVSALLARIYLYMDNYKEAYKNAKELIDNTAFRFIKEEEIIVRDVYNRPIKIDRTFMPEMVFALNSKRLLTTSSRYLEGLSEDFVKSKAAYAATDVRQNWFYVNASTINRDINLIRFQRSKSSDEITEYPDLVMPLLKLSEMYLIAAEASLKDRSLNASPIEYLNELKDARKAVSLTADATDEEIEKEITHEYICDFKGEGQLFLYYKRKNMSKVDDGQYGGNSIVIVPENYLFPLPQIEIDFGKGK